MDANSPSTPVVLWLGPLIMGLSLLLAITVQYWDRRREREDRIKQEAAREEALNARLAAKDARIAHLERRVEDLEDAHETQVERLNRALETITGILGELRVSVARTEERLKFIVPHSPQP